MKTTQVVISFVFVVVSFASCQQIRKDESVSDSLLTLKEKVKEPIRALTRKDILGVWGLVDSENATFSISDDSIYYIDSDKSYPYELISDTLKIFYEDWNYIGHVRYIPNDTLILKTEDEESIFIKFKK